MTTTLQFLIPGPEANAAIIFFDPFQNVGGSGELVPKQLPGHLPGECGHPPTLHQPTTGTYPISPSLSFSLSR